MTPEQRMSRAKTSGVDEGGPEPSAAGNQPPSPRQPVAGHGPELTGALHTSAATVLATLAKITGFRDLAAGWDGYRSAQPRAGEIALASWLAANITKVADLTDAIPLIDGGVRVRVEFDGKPFTIDIEDDS